MSPRRETRQQEKRDRTRERPAPLGLPIIAGERLPRLVKARILVPSGRQLSSTLSTLLVLPALYILFHRRDREPVTVALADGAAPAS